MGSSTNNNVLTIETIYSDEEFSISGPQLMSHRCVQMTCKHRNDGGPARFIIGDEIIPVTVNKIVDHDLRGFTSVGTDKIRVQNIEHVMSALLAMSVLDTDIYLNYRDGGQSETVISPPVLHLNSVVITNAISTCFLSKKLDQKTKTLDIKRSYIFQEEEEYVGNNDPGLAIFAPLEKLHITVHINFPVFWGKQAYSQTITPNDYAKSISWASVVLQ